MQIRHTLTPTHVIAVLVAATHWAASFGIAVGRVKVGAGMT